MKNLLVFGPWRLPWPRPLSPDEALGHEDTSTGRPAGEAVFEIRDLDACDSRRLKVGSIIYGCSLRVKVRITVMLPRSAGAVMCPALDVADMASGSEELHGASA
jgi:hypothetical protein